MSKRTEDIVMIGDRKHDVLGAKAVGLRERPAVKKC